MTAISPVSPTDPPHFDRPPWFREIVRAVAAVKDSSAAAICSHKRGKHPQAARDLVAALARLWTTMSHPQIAGMMDRRSHSPIIRAERRGRAVLAKSPGMEHEIAEEIEGQRALPYGTIDLILGELARGGPLRGSERKRLAVLAQHVEPSVTCTMAEYRDARRMYERYMGLEKLALNNTRQWADPVTMSQLLHAVSNLIGPVPCPGVPAEAFAYTAARYLMVPDRQIGRWLQVVTENEAVEYRQRYSLRVKHRHHVLLTTEDYRPARAVAWHLALWAAQQQPPPSAEKIAGLISPYGL